jgi:hypothetical protein
MLDWVTVIQEAQTRLMGNTLQYSLDVPFPPLDVRVRSSALMMGHSLTCVRALS